MGYFVFNEKTFLDKYGFDRDLDEFKKILDTDSESGLGLELTLREIVQNSLDARLFKHKPVKLIVDLTTVDKHILPGIDEIFTRIDKLKAGNDYNFNTIKNMKSMRELKNVRMLTVEDQNTTGLSGADSPNKDSQFYSYAYSTGNHFKANNLETESTRGGSHGIGKIASNAASQINLMYFANNDGKGNAHLSGTVVLIDHEYKGKIFSDRGYFSKVDSDKIIPYKNSFDGFEKNTRGLKIFIPYIKESFHEIKNVVKSICNNYFVTILENNLVVEVKENGVTQLEINCNTIQDIVNDEKYYKDNIIMGIEEFTPRYVDTYLNKKTQKLKVTLQKQFGNQEFNFDICLSDNPEGSKRGRIALLRSIGMKIEDYQVKGFTRYPFNAVLIGGTKEDKFIKSLENISHTQLSSDNIENDLEKKKADNFLNSLRKSLQDFLGTYYSEDIDESGDIDTKDIFYISTQKFEEVNKKTQREVEIKDGTGSGKKIIEKRDKRKEKRKQTPLNQSSKSRTPKKIQEKSDGNLSFSLNGASIKRLNLRGKEKLFINIDDINRAKDIDKFNLKFILVDGEGNNIDSYSIMDIYNKVIDDTGKNLKINNNTIENIRFKNSTATIELYTNAKQNKFKFIYELEERSDI